MIPVIKQIYEVMGSIADGEAQNICPLCQKRATERHNHIWVHHCKVAQKFIGWQTITER
jgi:ribosomal protein L37AE/L43A